MEASVQAALSGKPCLSVVSILGPLLFLIYIKDFVASINLFADDKSLYLIVASPIACSSVFNQDIVQIHI